MTFISPRRFKNWLTAYSQYTSKTEAPAHFHLWSGMFAIASTLGRNVWIDMGAFDWIPNMYVVFIGSPGVVTKSTSIRLAENLIRQTETVAFGSNSSTWQQLAREMQASTASDFEGGQATSSLTLTVSELGSFLDMSNREQIDFLVDIWDGHKGIWKRSTVGGGSIIIDHPCLNLIGATTPTWIQSNFQQSVVGGGLSSRMILLLGKEKRHLIAYPGLDGIGLDMEMGPLLVEDLKRISELKGPMTLTDDAIEWGRAWYLSHIKQPHLRQLLGEKFEHYYARKQTHLHKIAIILCVATSDSLIITKRHLQAANGILLDMEKGYGEALAYVQAGNYFASAKVEVQRIIAIKHPEPIAKRDLYKQVAATISGMDFERILLDLIKAESIIEVVGGSSSRYKLNMHSMRTATDSVQDDRQDAHDN